MSVRLIKLVLAMAAMLLAVPSMAAAAGKELLVCGWDEVFILDVGQPAAAVAKVWRWKAVDRPEIPAHIKAKFKTTSDCKPVTGNRILIVASDDGVALVDRATGKAGFWGACDNAHSAELLPGERIVVACSVGDGGNRLSVFDARTPERELFSTELYSGHGALWDDQRKLLWALGGRELRAYSLAMWNSEKPALKLEASYPLPSSGGHDLVEVGDPARLALTTTRQAWLFDRSEKTFSPHSELGQLRNVKSISLHPETRQVVYTQADEPEWWTATIRFLHPERTVKLDGERMYKVRWMK